MTRSPTGHGGLRSARTLGVEEPVLRSWLLSYRVRNICAHHGRLWNRGLGVTPVIPKSESIRWLQDRDLFTRDEWRRQRLFPVLVSLQTLLHQNLARIALGHSA